MTESPLLTLRELITLRDAGVIPDHVLARIERGETFAATFCWCGRASGEHVSRAGAAEPTDHAEESAGTDSLHRLLGLGQPPVEHAPSQHVEVLQQWCVRCGIDRWRLEQDKATRGHRDLRVSDFGWWHCRSCGRRGDDWMSPADYPCTPETGFRDV